MTEIALIIGIVGLVFIGMEIYARRGIQGKVKDLADKIIGKEQSSYQQDTSGLEINTSKSEYASWGATTRVTESPGGVRTTEIKEHPAVGYTYNSQDSLGR